MLLQAWIVIAIALVYIGLLFVVASYGDRRWRSRARRPLAAADLSAVSGDLLHLLDLLRLGRPRFAFGLRLPHDLCRADADDRARHAAVPAHRAARQEPEHHLDRRFHRRALRQAAIGGGAGGADRDRRHHSLYRAAAESRVGDVRHGVRACGAAIHPEHDRRYRACWSRSRWPPSRSCSAPAISTRPSIRTA